MKAHLGTVTDRAAAPIIAKYTAVLAAADIEVFTRTTTFAILQSLRLDSGPSGQVYPWHDSWRYFSAQPCPAVTAVRGARQNICGTSHDLRVASPASGEPIT